MFIYFIFIQKRYQHDEGLEESTKIIWEKLQERKRAEIREILNIQWIKISWSDFSCESSLMIKPCTISNHDWDD